MRPMIIIDCYAVIHIQRSHNQVVWRSTEGHIEPLHNEMSVTSKIVEILVLFIKYVLVKEAICEI